MKNTSGFTLFELMVTIALMGILLGIGVPSMQTMLLNNRVTSSVNRMVSDIQLARSESITRGQVVSICPRNAAGTACAAGDRGWIVFVDYDNDGDRDIGATPDEELIAVREALPDRILLKTAVTGLSFRPFGTRSTNGTLIFCDDRDAGATSAEYARAIIIGTTGRPRISKTDTAGNALDCS